MVPQARGSSSRIKQREAEKSRKRQVQSVRVRSAAWCEAGVPQLGNFPRLAKLPDSIIFSPCELNRFMACQFPCSTSCVYSQVGYIYQLPPVGSCQASVAQLAEQLICNQQVVGSSPSAGSSEPRETCCPSSKRVIVPGGYPSGQRGQTVNLMAMPSKVRILHPPVRNDEGRNQNDEDSRVLLPAGVSTFEFRHSDIGACGCSSMVERQPSKLMTRVRFPSPALAAVAQLVERVLGKDEVKGSNPFSSPRRQFDS